MLLVRAFSGLLFLLVLLGVILFGAAGTVHYWHAWTFLGVFGGVTFVITVYLAAKDRALLERRVRAGPGAEEHARQKVIQALASLAFVALFLVSALDHRLGWTSLAFPIVMVGNGLVALGLAMVFFVFRANSFTSGTIEVAADQRVICTGPYAVVRHPMYAGAFVMLVGVPLALV